MRAGLLVDAEDGTVVDQRSAPHPPGTEVELELGEDHRPLADTDTLRAIVARYCGLLDVPVVVGGEPVNAAPPPWRDPDAPETPHPAERHRRRAAVARRARPRRTR